MVPHSRGLSSGILTYASLLCSCWNSRNLFIFSFSETADNLLGCWISQPKLFYCHEIPDHTKLSNFKVKKNNNKKSSVLHNFFMTPFHWIAEIQTQLWNVLSFLLNLHAKMTQESWMPMLLWLTCASEMDAPLRIKKKMGSCLNAYLGKEMVRAVPASLFCCRPQRIWAPPAKASRPGVLCGSPSFLPHLWKSITLNKTDLFIWLQSMLLYHIITSPVVALKI